MTPNNRILLNGVLRPKLLNIPFAFFFFQHITFDDSIVLSFLVFNTFGCTFSVFVFHIKQNDMTFNGFD